MAELQISLNMAASKVLAKESVYKCDPHWLAKKVVP